MNKKSKGRTRVTYKPEGHTLYWVYGYVDKTGEYNFDTTTNFAEAKKMARRFVVVDDFDYAYIWYGNEDGAFTEIDYAECYYPKTKKEE